MQNRARSILKLSISTYDERLLRYVHGCGQNHGKAIKIQSNKLFWAIV